MAVNSLLRPSVPLYCSLHDDVRIYILLSTVASWRHIRYTADNSGLMPTGRMRRRHKHRRRRFIPVWTDRATTHWLRGGTVTMVTAAAASKHECGGITLLLRLWTRLFMTRPPDLMCRLEIDAIQYSILRWRSPIRTRLCRFYRLILFGFTVTVFRVSACFTRDSFVYSTRSHPEQLIIKHEIRHTHRKSIEG